MWAREIKKTQCIHSDVRFILIFFSPLFCTSVNVYISIWCLRFISFSLYCYQSCRCQIRILNIRFADTHTNRRRKKCSYKHNDTVPHTVSVFRNFWINSISHCSHYYTYTHTLSLTLSSDSDFFTFLMYTERKKLLSLSVTMIIHVCESTDIFSALFWFSFVCVWISCFLFIVYPPFF